MNCWNCWFGQLLSSHLELFLDPFIAAVLSPQLAGPLTGWANPDSLRPKKKEAVLMSGAGPISVRTCDGCVTVKRTCMHIDKGCEGNFDHSKHC